MVNIMTTFELLLDIETNPEKYELFKTAQVAKSGVYVALVWCGEIWDREYQRPVPAYVAKNVPEGFDMILGATSLVNFSL